jgi:hypothetical protein
LATPLGVNLVSASLPRCPKRMTLLTLRDAMYPELYHSPLRADETGEHEPMRARASSFGKYGET